MDEIEITVFDEIKDYKEKIYFLNFRQWIFAILILVIVIPTYLILKNIIGEEITSYIVIGIAGILGFIGFVKIHELPAEKIIPFWFRHILFFAKPIHYMTDEEYKLQHQKKNKRNIDNTKNKDIKHNDKKLIKKKEKHTKVSKSKNTENLDNSNITELSKKLSKLSKEQQDALLKLIER